MSDAPQSKRYIIHDFLIGSPILIDRRDKTLTFYHTNIYGQIIHLGNPQKHYVGAAKTSGLIRRLNGYASLYNCGYAVDPYIYTYLFTSEQQAACRRSLDIPQLDALIAATDSYHEAITKMCEWVFENEKNEKVYGETDREKLTQYYKTYLAELPLEPHIPSQMPDVSKKKRAAPSRGTR